MTDRPVTPIRARFTEGSIMRHVAVMTATGSIGLIAIFIVDLVNLFYISRLGVQELAAAIGFSSVVLFFQSALCIGIAIGTGAIVGRHVGAGDRAAAMRMAGTSLLFMLVVAGFVGLAVLPFVDPILTALGATGRTHDLADQYLHIVSPSLPLLGLGMALSALLRSVADARRAMTITLYGAAVAAVLDPILIFVFDLGLTGAAIATIASRLTLVIVGWHGASRVHGIVGWPERPRLKADIGQLLSIAGPAILTNVATPVGSAYVTSSLGQYGDAAVAGQATVDRLVPVAFGVIFALTGAVGPVFAQNLGAGKFDRVRETLKDSLIMTTGYVLLAWLALFLSQDLLVQAFSVRGEGEVLLRLFCTWLAGSALFLGFLFVANASFNNLGYPLLSTGFNWGRATLGTIPFAMVGAHLGGAAGVVIGQAFGTILFGSAAVLTAFRVVGRLHVRGTGQSVSFWAPMGGAAGSGRASLATMSVVETVEVPPEVEKKR